MVKLPRVKLKWFHLHMTRQRWLVHLTFDANGDVVLMQPDLIEYLPIAMFIVIAFGMAGALVGASRLIAKQRPDPEKLSAYECGFEAFSDSRKQFEVQFYLVSILFIIFDLEIAFLFPWAITFSKLGALGFGSMMAFLFVLTVGFLYEWRKGALEWH